MVKNNPKKKNAPDLDTLLEQIKSENGDAKPQKKKTRLSRKFSSPLFRTSKENNCCNCCDDMLGMLSIVNDSVTRVLDALKAEHLLDKKITEKFKKDQEEKDRRDKENLLESSGRKLTTSLQRAISPLKNVMDSIFKFLLFTLLGRTVGKILKWFSDPSNDKKVKSLTRFLKDWWPAILGAFVLFGTKFGAAIRATVGMAVSTILYLKKIGIPGILAGLKKFGKFGLIVGGVAGAAFVSNKLLNQEKENKENIRDTVSGGGESKPKSSPALKMLNGGIIPRLNLFSPQEKNVNEISYAEGGSIDESSGISITGAGPDTQLIAAQPGEIVISKAAVDKFGADTFLKMNLMAGSSNRPKFANNIQLAAQGGMVGKNQTYQPNSQKFNINSPKLFLSNRNIIDTSRQGSRISFGFSNLNRNQAIQRSPRMRVNYNLPQVKTNFDSYGENSFRFKSIKYFGPNYNFLRPSRRVQLASINQATSYSPYQNKKTGFNKYSISYNLKNERPQTIFYENAHITPTLENIKIPGPRPVNTVNVAELPAIDLRANRTPKNNEAQSEVPEFSAIPRLSDRYGNGGTLSIYGIKM